MILDFILTTTIFISSGCEMFLKCKMKKYVVSRMCLAVSQTRTAYKKLSSYGLKFRELHIWKKNQWEIFEMKIYVQFVT